MRRLYFFLLASILASIPAHAERWKLQYFYDTDEDSLRIVDLKFPSAQRGIAAGMLVDSKDGDKQKSVVLVTSDGGDTWSTVEVKDNPQSLFFLDDSTGWMVTNRGLQYTEESGRSWKKMKAPKNLLRVYFLDRLHGFGVGTHKEAYRTVDGGEHWEDLPAAAEVASSEDYTVYEWIDFANPKIGAIVGWSRPPRRGGWRDQLPAWVDPETAATRPQWPTMSILLETHDAGVTWQPSSASIFGRIAKMRMSPGGAGLGLVMFDDWFEYPSEVSFVDWRTGKSQRTFREKNRRITDVAIAGSSGPFYIAGHESRGKLNALPIPDRVHVLTSPDGKGWKEMKVDYRATANNVILAATGSGQVWAATDTGMILKLVP